MKIERKLHAHAINKIYNKAYMNMEERLKSYFDMFDNRVPIIFKDNIPNISLDEYFKRMINGQDLVDTKYIIGISDSFDDNFFNIDFIDHRVPEDFNPNDYRVRIDSVVYTPSYDKLNVLFITYIILEKV